MSEERTDETMNRLQIVKKKGTEGFTDISDLKLS